MSEIKIDKGVPIPKDDWKKGRDPTYPWRNLEVGDSFFAPNVKLLSMRSLTSRNGVLLGFKLQPKLVEENGIKGVRVWRIA